MKGLPLPSVLFVDDDALNVKVFSGYLQKNDLDVLGVDSFEGAVRMTQEHEIAVLVTDLRLDASNGVDLFHRARATIPRMRGILISAYFPFEDKSPIRDAGFDMALPKPFTSVKGFLAAVQRSMSIYENWAAFEEI